MRRIRKQIRKPVLITIAAIIILAFITGILSMIAVVGSVLENPIFDTTPISNIGFLMLLALSNTCFNWSKALEVDKEAIEGGIIKLCAVIAMLGAVCFALGSLSKYLLLESLKGETIAVLFTKAVDKTLFSMSAFTLFNIASLLTILCIILIIVCFVTVYITPLFHNSKLTDKGN